MFLPPRNRRKTLLALSAAALLWLFVLNSNESKPQQTSVPVSVNKHQHLKNTEKNKKAPYQTEQQESELLYTLHHQLLNLQIALNSQTLNNNVRKQFQSRIGFLLNTVDQIIQLRGKKLKTKADDLSEKIQNRLHQLQNPDRCDEAQKMVCRLKNQYGFGGMLHHMTACYNIGLATNRVVLFHYELGDHYKLVLMNESKCSVDANEVKGLPPWNGKPAASRRLVPFKMDLRLKSSIFPTHSLPQDVAPTLQSFHGLPVAWFQGQIVKFILRPVGHLQREVKLVEEQIEFSTPILGMQVRRTDRVNDYHDDEEYMKLAEIWFDVYDQRRILHGEQPLKKRRIFLAADDPNTVITLRASYSKYEFITNTQASELVQSKDRRNQNEALLGVLVDIHILSKCSHLLCDGVSNVCRAAYELMQTRFVDASTRFTYIGAVYINLPYKTLFHLVMTFTNASTQDDPKKIRFHRKNEVRRITNVLPVNAL